MRKSMKKYICFFSLAVVCFMACLIFGTGNAAAAVNNMKIHAIELKEHGDAVVVESNGEYIIMDLGSYTDYATIQAYLKKIGVKEISLYYSHFDPDHTGGCGNGKFGIENLMADFTVSHVYLPDPGVCPSGNLESYCNTVEEHYSKHYNYSELEMRNHVTYLKTGSSFTIGTAVFQVIGPVGVSHLTVDIPDENSDGNDKSNYVNNCSLVTMVTCGNTKFLSTGDVKTEEEEQLVKTYGAAGLKADIYKMSHHGLTPANSEKLLACIQPVYSFAQNAGFTENVAFGDGTRKHRRTYASRMVCSEYGFCYMVGDEKAALVIDVTNDVVTLAKDGTAGPALNARGWTKVFGSDGVDILYDYYYFGDNGKPLTGVQVIDGKTYYLGNGGCRNAGTYIYENGKKTYRGWEFYEDGSGKKLRRYFEEGTDVMYTGFHKIDKSLYYFDEKTGILKTGSKNGKKVKIGKYYYAIYEGGSICTNGFRKYSGGSCYFGKDGKMATGWAKINKKKYYFDLETGYRLTGIQTIDNRVYVFNAYGMLNENEKINIDNKVYFTRADGSLKGLPKVSAVSLKSVKAGSKKATVSWKMNKKVDGYEVYYATAEKGDYALGATVKKNRTTKATIKKLKKGRTYYIKVRGYKKFGTGKLYSKYSSVKKVKVK